LAVINGEVPPQFLTFIRQTYLLPGCDSKRSRRQNKTTTTQRTFGHQMHYWYISPTRICTQLCWVFASI
jgi:hypothetical protein